MQWSVRINEAYQRLKDPLRRAAYLCELRGAPINAENNTAMPRTFLMAADGLARGAGRRHITAADLDALECEVMPPAASAGGIGKLLDVEGDADACRAAGASPHVHRAFCP
jgi:molecular chaperone HscB